MTGERPAPPVSSGSAGEFDLIERYFASLGPRHPETRLAVGDDAALVDLDAAAESATVWCPLPQAAAGAARAADTAFRRTAAALRARGWEPRFATLALTRAGPDTAWAGALARALEAAAHALGVQVVGGDTTRGDPALTLTLHAVRRVPDADPDADPATDPDPDPHRTALPE